MTLRDRIADTYNLGHHTYNDDPLNGINQALSELGHPENNYQTVLVTGTKGAGSTCDCISAILQEAGYDVGTFSGYAVTDKGVREKYRTNNQFASTDKLWELAEHVTEAVGTQDEWDVLVAMAAYYFATNNVDVAVFEAGIGGETDAVNGIDADVAVVTNAKVTEYHSELGDTDVAVARNKAGLINDGTVAVSNGTTEVNNTVRAVADKRDGDYAPLTDNLQFTWDADTDSTTVTYRGEQTDTPILADYQRENVTTAVTAVEHGPFDVSDDAVLSALESFAVPGRCELRDGSPPVLFDGAHNELAARALVDTVRKFDGEKTLVFGGATGWHDMLKHFVEPFDSLIITDPHDENTPSVDDVQMHYPKAIGIATPQHAVEVAKRLTDDDGLVVVTGTLSLVNEVR